MGAKAGKKCSACCDENLDDCEGRCELKNAVCADKFCSGTDGLPCGRCEDLSACGGPFCKADRVHGRCRDRRCDGSRQSLGGAASCEHCPPESVAADGCSGLCQRGVTAGSTCVETAAVSAVAVGASGAVQSGPRGNTTTGGVPAAEKEKAGITYMTVVDAKGEHLQVPLAPAM